MIRVRLFLVCCGVAGVMSLSGAWAQGIDLPKRLTHPQVVAGGGFESAIVLLNSSTTTCEYAVVAHRNAGSLDRDVVVGGQTGGVMVGFLPPGAGRTVSLQAPDGVFVGAVSVDMYTPECFNSFTAQTQIRFVRSDGGLSGVFSYLTPQAIKPGQCALAAIQPDLDPSDGRTVTPGFAAASLERLEGVQLCHSLRNSQGAAIAGEACFPTDGAHQARLLTDIFNDIDADASTWQVCIEGQTGSGPIPALRPLFIDVVTQAGVSHFDVSEHQVLDPKCIEDQFNACLADRFGVYVGYQQTPLAPTRRAIIGSLSDGQTAYFHFGDLERIELAVALVDGCAVNGHYWVFASSTSTQQYEITVVDTRTDQTKTYPVPFGGSTTPIADTEAFATCP